MIKRPVTPVVLGVFFLFSTCILIGVGFVLTWPGTPIDAIWALKPERQAELTPYRTWLGPAFLVLAFVMGAASVGCFKRRLWGWRLAIAIFAVNGIGDVVQILLGHFIEGAIGVAAAGAILYWLLQSRVRVIFRRKQAR